jgi:hypothetical protein
MAQNITSHYCMRGRQVGVRGQEIAIRHLGSDPAETYLLYSHLTGIQGSTDGRMKVDCYATITVSF